MDKINNKKIKKPKRISKTLGVLKGIKTHESCLYERFNNAKIVDIEDSTRYQMDNSFHETHERVMAYKDNLNEEEMLDPDTEKQNYYN